MSKIRFPGKASDFLKIGVAAAARGEVEAVRAILEGRPGWLGRVGPHGRTMLWEASHRGKLGMVKYLVERGADVDACGTHYTPYIACPLTNWRHAQGARSPDGSGSRPLQPPVRKERGAFQAALAP